MPHTRVLAAIDEQIGLCEDELTWARGVVVLGANFAWEFIRTDKERLMACLVRMRKLDKLMHEVKRDKFVELGYKDEFVELKTEIKRLYVSMKKSKDEIQKLKDAAKTIEETSADLPNNQNSPHGSSALFYYDSDEDRSDLTDDT
jgi:hypothetical protein